MGTSESKMAVAATPKPAPILRPMSRRVAELVDPRSPSCGIDRTPIQVGATSNGHGVQESARPVFFDPRSPTAGIARTPLKDSVKVTVSSLARRLSTFFLNDVTVGDSTSTPLPPVSFTKHPSLPAVDQQDELSSKEPLLPPDFGAPTVCPSTPQRCSYTVGYGSFCSSPFVVVGEAQVELDGDTTLEEGEEALLLGGSPLNRELSLSLLACREGVYSPEYLPSAEERPSSPVPPEEQDEEADHTYARPCVLPASPVQKTPEPSPEKEEATQDPKVPEQAPVQSEKPEPANTSTKSEPSRPARMFPKFDTCSPSQAVFKPQWLGVGFGTSGVRARGLQSRGKAPALPLSTSVAPMDENENKVVLSKQKQRGKALIGEGRSPLQTLKEANSPRNHNAQMRLKVSTPEKQRLGQIDRRALILSLNKENH